MTTILVGIDDSPRSEDALAFAGPLGATSGATVVLACAFPYDDTPSRFSNPELRATLEDQAEQTLRHAADRLEGVDPARVKTIAVASVSVPRALDRLAESEHAEMIVIGSSHTGRLRRVFPGSTAERLLHGAPCPVAVVPNRYTPHVDRARQIGVAYDGGQESVTALNAATRVARALDGHLRVIHVLDADAFAAPALMLGPGYTESRDTMDMRARNGLEQAMAGLPADVHAEAVFLAGEPVRELVNQSSGLDLLVAGSRGYGPARSVLLGGVTGRLIREAACPLIILPRGHDTPLDALFGVAAAAAAA